MKGAPRRKRKWAFNDIVLSAPPPGKKSHDAAAVESAERRFPSEELLDLDGHAPECDWSVKTRVQIRSSRSFSWARTSHSIIEDKTLEDFSKARGFWMHPAEALPGKWAQSAASELVVGIGQFFRERIQLWETSFHGVFFSWLRRKISYFYICSPGIFPESTLQQGTGPKQKTAFSRGSSSKGKHGHGRSVCILFKWEDEPLVVFSASTAKLRDELELLGIEFECTSEKEDTGKENVEDAASFLKLQPSLQVRGKENCLGVADALSEAVLLTEDSFQPSSGNANATSRGLPTTRFFEHFSAGDVPQILAPVPFTGATARSLEMQFCGRIQGSAAETNGTDEFLLELVGPILPGVEVELARCVREVFVNKVGDSLGEEQFPEFQVTLRPDPATTLFNDGRTFTSGLRITPRDSYRIVDATRDTISLSQ